MVTNKTFSQYLKNKIKSKGSLIFFAIPALWIASFLIYSFITKKEFLLKTLKSYSGIFSRAITSGDWEMVVSLQKNLNITFEIFNIHLEKLGELHSKANYGLFPYCETIKSSSISEENITGCIHILNLNDIFIISTLLLIMVAAYFLLKKTVDSIVLEIDQYFKSIISTIETSLSKMEIQDQWPHSLLETRNLFGAIEIMISNSINHAADSKIAKIASQVSHDIRSPLAALEMINSNLSELPEDKRSIIKNSINRIRDIANDLLYERSKNSSNTTTPNDIVTSNIVETQCIHLYPLIDSIVSEKRIQYRGLIDIEIDFIYNNDIYGMFANLNTKDIKRALSNLINNAVESIENKSGKVIISLNSTENDLQISIVDTGKGMSPELLSKIGTVSFTHGKNNGNGIGIIQSIEAIKNSNGTFEIFSEINKGTEIKIKFKKAKEPVWFIPELVVTDSHKILVLDDDVTIHQVWVQRFKEIFKINDFEIFHFSNLKDFKKYYGVNFAELDEALFLIDYEISNNQQTGLDLIFELGINSQSVLVTSRYDENSIIQACENANVRLLPKLLSTSIPIKIEDKSH